MIHRAWFPQVGRLPKGTKVTISVTPNPQAKWTVFTRKKKRLVGYAISWKASPKEMIANAILDAKKRGWKIISSQIIH